MDIRFHQFFEGLHSQYGTVQVGKLLRTWGLQTIFLYDTGCNMATQELKLKRTKLMKINDKYQVYNLYPSNGF